MDDVSALFKRLQLVFGESNYGDMTEDLQPNHWRLFSYRNKERVCVDYITRTSPTDQAIIKRHLSKLTYDELNATDANGASILHLAVQYNRCGQTGYSNTWNETHKNIVKWLLQNPAFNQESANGAFLSEKYEHGYYVKNPLRLHGISGNAFHLAFAAQVPRDIQFCSENFGGELGSTYVAGGALDVMLREENFARAHVNSCNQHGHSVLEYALQMAMERLDKIDFIIFNDAYGKGKTYSFDETSDCSILTYARDYPKNIQKLLECKYLRLHNTFGVVMMSNEEGNCLMPQQLVRRERQSTLLTPTKGMEVFIKLCTQVYRMSRGGRDTIVDALLSHNCGQLPDSVKAQSMSVCFSPLWRRKWIFNPPELRDKKIGTIVRKFFVKHAGSALYAIQRYTSIIHLEYEEILLCNVRDALCEKYSLSSKIWKDILAYAGYRNDNRSRLATLSDLNDTIQNSVLPFFYGGIQSCIDRKLEEHVPADAWCLIFQFAGLRPRFRKNLDEILGPPVKVKNDTVDSESEDEDDDSSSASDGESDSGSDKNPDSGSDEDSDSDIDDDNNNNQNKGRKRSHRSMSK